MFNPRFGRDMNQTATFSENSALADYSSQINALRETGKMFYDRGWSLGTSSNYSVVINRDPLELLITASGKDKGRLGPTDFVRVDSLGKPTLSGQPKSSAETMLHCVLAKMPDVGSVLHTHSVWSTILSQIYYAPEKRSSGFAIEDYEMLKGLQGVTTHQHSEWVQIFDNTQDIQSLSITVDSILESDPNRLCHGFLMRQHGLYTWGKDIEEARRHVEIFEFLFECVARKIQLSDKSMQTT